LAFGAEAFEVRFFGWPLPELLPPLLLFALFGIGVCFRGNEMKEWCHSGEKERLSLHFLQGINTVKEGFQELTLISSTTVHCSMSLRGIQVCNATGVDAGPCSRFHKRANTLTTKNYVKFVLQPAGFQPLGFCSPDCQVPSAMKSGFRRLCLSPFEGENGFWF
jgi:hypothetical protein